MDLLGHLRRRIALDGLPVSSVDHPSSVPWLVEHVLPLMEQDGLREPHHPGVTPAPRRRPAVGWVGEAAIYGAGDLPATSRHRLAVGRAGPAASRPGAEP